MPTTAWFTVRQATSPNAAERRAAQAELYRTYHPHVLRSLRRREVPAARAADAAQEFFAKLFDLEDKQVGKYLPELRPEKGSFGGWVQCVSWSALLNALKWENCKKRGGGVEHVNIDREEVAAIAGDAPIRESFDDECAKTFIVQRAYERLQGEYPSPSDALLVSDLYRYLRGEERISADAELAAELKVTGDCVRARRYRVRDRFKRLLVSEACNWFGRSDCIEAELRRLALLD